MTGVFARTSCDPRVAGHGLLDDVVGLAQPLDGHVHQEEGREEGPEIAGADGPFGDALRAHPEDEGADDAAQELHERRGEAPDPGQLDARPQIAGRGLQEPADLELLGREGLDDLVPGDGLVEKPVDLAHLDLGRQALLLELAAEDGHRDGGQRGHDEGDHGQPEVPDEDPDEQGDEGEDLLDHVAHASGQGLLDLLDVVGHPAHQVARRHVVEVARRLVDDVLVEVVAHRLDDPVADGLHEEGREEREQPLAEDDDDQDDGQDPGDVGLGHVEGPEDGVHQPGLFRDRRGRGLQEEAVQDGLDHVHENVGEEGHEDGRAEGQEEELLLLEGQLEETEDVFHASAREAGGRALATARAFRAEPAVRLSATTQNQKPPGMVGSALISPRTISSFPATDEAAATPPASCPASRKAGSALKRASTAPRSASPCRARRRP